MLKTRVAAVILSLTMAVGVLAACSSKKSSTPDKLVDGVYKVEYDNYDAHGYKGQLELTISGGKITEAKFDEVTKDGKLKSKDEQYKKQMEEGSETYPEKAYSTLRQEILDKQSANVDAVTGATTSSNAFKELAKYAINEMAAKGKTNPATIPAPKK